jgi:hypothetical protein
MIQTQIYTEIKREIKELVELDQKKAAYQFFIEKEMDIRFGKQREFHEQFSGYEIPREYFEKKSYSFC